MDTLQVERTMRNGSISSEGSLTWSEGSSNSESELVTTPPDTPRTSGFQFEQSPSTWTEISDEIEVEMDTIMATDALSELDLAQGPFTSPSKSSKAAHISRWASELGLPGSPTSPTPSSPFRTAHKLKRPDLRMDLSGIPTFTYGTNNSPTTAQLMNAPRIGCEPSPTGMAFSPMTPRPTLLSRFSDESSSSSSSGADTPPMPSPSIGPVSAAKLALPGLLGPQPMTPRTVDALDCFGISSSATSCLMTRGRSKDKAGMNGKLQPARSPLSMPPYTFGSGPPIPEARPSPQRFMTHNPYFAVAPSSA